MEKVYLYLEMEVGTVCIFENRASVSYIALLQMITFISFMNKSILSHLILLVELGKKISARHCLTLCQS